MNEVPRIKSYAEWEAEAEEWAKGKTQEQMREEIRREIDWAAKMDACIARSRKVQENRALLEAQPIEPQRQGQAMAMLCMMMRLRCRPPRCDGQCRSFHTGGAREPGERVLRLCPPGS
jgi:hypothetical protein